MVILLLGLLIMKLKRKAIKMTIRTQDNLICNTGNWIGIHQFEDIYDDSKPYKIWFELLKNWEFSSWNFDKIIEKSSFSFTLSLREYTIKSTSFSSKPFFRTSTISVNFRVAYFSFKLIHLFFVAIDCS